MATAGVKRDAGKVLITGISGGLGRLLARRLHRTENIIGVDRRPFKGMPKDIWMHRLDYRKKKFENIFRSRDIKAVYHLGHTRNPRKSDMALAQSADLEGTKRLFDYCDKYGVRKLILLSSANVYGALPTNDQFLKEDAPLLGGLRFPQIRFFVEMDMLAQSFFWKHEEIETVILRPVHILGPNLHNAASNLLRLKVVPTVMVSPTRMGRSTSRMMPAMKLEKISWRPKPRPKPTAAMSQPSRPRSRWMAVSAMTTPRKTMP